MSTTSEPVRAEQWFLHAAAAAWSLSRSRAELYRMAGIEAREQAATSRTLAAAAGLQAWRPMVGRAMGGHGDPAGRAALDSVEPVLRPGRLARLFASVTDTLVWLATEIRARPASDPLDAIRYVLPELRPGSGREVRRWLAGEDDRIRRAIRLEPEARVPVPDNPPCPLCGLQLLRVQTSPGEMSAWLVVCTGPDCRCAGADCSCGLPGGTPGDEHAWPAVQWVTYPWMAACRRGA